MGVYKRCTHTGKDRDRCDHEWYASYLVRGFPRAKVALAKWAGLRPLEVTQSPVGPWHDICLIAKKD